MFSIAGADMGGLIEPLRSARSSVDGAIRTQRHEDITRGFRSIGLDELNAKAGMLTRLDNKYVVHIDVLRALLPRLAKHFDVLDIDGTRQFEYDTRYFDDVALTSYFDHHGKRRKRCKVRTRLYVGSDLCFVEIKLKDKRGVTVKRRMRYPAAKHGTLDDAAMEHVRSAYVALYGTPFDVTLRPTLGVRYRRMTLVSLLGAERMTIDRDLAFASAGGAGRVDSQLCVVETKSRNANGIADKILRAAHQHPTPRCSKYCVGMAAVQEVQRYNRFLPALRKLHLVPEAPVFAQCEAPPSLFIPARARSPSAASSTLTRKRVL